MRHVGVSVDVDAPVEAVWELLTKVDRWPEWGTTVRRVESTADRIDVGTSGRVQTIAGFWLPFTVTEKKVVPGLSLSSVAPEAFSVPSISSESPDPKVTV